MGYCYQNYGHEQIYLHSRQITGERLYNRETRDGSQRSMHEGTAVETDAILIKLVNGAEGAASSIVFAVA